MAVATLRQEQQPQYPAIKPGMMGMYIFLASEVMFFGSLFAVYFYLYGSHLVWPPPPPSTNNEFYVSWYPIPLVNTGILLSCGVTCHFASDAIAQDNRRRFFVLQIATIILGVLFELGQLYEFINAFQGGLILLVLVLYRASRGQFSSRHHVAVAAVTLYWHFVDVVWIFLFAILYLGVTAFR